VPVLRGLSTNTPEITRRISNALFTNTMRVVKYLLFIILKVRWGSTERETKKF
jgi:hypothetical protein